MKPRPTGVSYWEKITENMLSKVLSIGRELDSCPHPTRCYRLKHDESRENVIIFKGKLRISV
jgi:hypothetical protein